MDSTFEAMRLYAVHHKIPHVTKLLDNGNSVLVVITNDNHVCYVEWTSKSVIVGYGHMNLLEGRYAFVHPVR